MAPIAADCVAAIVSALTGEWQSIHWTASVLLPLAILIWFANLYQTGHWSFLALAVMHSLVPGSGLIIQGVQGRLTPGGPWGHLAGCPMAVLIAFGAWYLTAGLGLMLLPSVRAFIVHQRERAAAARKPGTSQ
jgi:hypothetical protein